MKTIYFADKVGPYWGIDKKPSDLPSISSIMDYDEAIEVQIEFANYFTCVQVNPRGFERGEPNYFTTHHLTLEAAERAAKIRYETSTSKFKRPVLIYAVMRFSDNPIGSSQPITGYPKFNNPYGFEARLAKRKGRPAKLPKGMRNMPERPTGPAGDRYFEGPRPAMSHDDIMRALSDTTVIGKGKSVLVGKFRNKRR